MPGLASVGGITSSEDGGLEHEDMNLLRSLGGAKTACSHVPDQIATPSGDRCEECGSSHSLRMCATCGHVGCCESQAGPRPPPCPRVRPPGHHRDARGPRLHLVLRGEPLRRLTWIPSPPPARARAPVRGGRPGRPARCRRARRARRARPGRAGGRPPRRRRRGSPSGSTSTTPRSGRACLADPARYRRRWRFFTDGGRHRGRPAPEPERDRARDPPPVGAPLGLGYLRNPAPSPFERRHARRARVDPRIHFALNCGARSCPPLAAWDPATLDADLERATAAYVGGPRPAGPPTGARCGSPACCSGTAATSGAGRGSRAPAPPRRHRRRARRPRIRFGDYDWTLDLGDAAR